MNKKVTTAQLTQILADKDLINGITFVGFDMLTVPKLKGGKGNAHQGRITKLSTGYVGMIASNKVSSAYENMVNRRLLQEGKEANFEAGKLPWGQRVEGTCLIENKGQHYVQLLFTQHKKTLLDMVEKMGITLDDNLRQRLDQVVVGYEGQRGTVQYFLDGQPIAKEDIEGLETDKSEGKQGGLSDDFKVIVRSPKVSSLVRLTMKGDTYLIED